MLASPIIWFFELLREESTSTIEIEAEGSTSEHASFGVMDGALVSLVEANDSAVFDALIYSGRSAEDGAWGTHTSDEQQ